MQIEHQKTFFLYWHIWIFVSIGLITFLNNIVLCEIPIGHKVNINSCKKDNKGDKLTIFHCILVCLQYAIFSATYLSIQCLFWPKIRILMTLFIIHSPFKEFTKVSYSFNFCYSGKILSCNTISIWYCIINILCHKLIWNTHYQCISNRSNGWICYLQEWLPISQHLSANYNLDHGVLKLQ